MQSTSIYFEFEMEIAKRNERKKKINLNLSKALQVGERIQIFPRLLEKTWNNKFYRGN